MAYLGDIRKGPRRIGVPVPYGGVPAMLPMRKGSGQRGGFLLGALAAHGAASALKPMKLVNRIMDNTGFSKKKGGKVLRNITGHLGDITGYGRKRHKRKHRRARKFYGGSKSMKKKRTIVIL